ncbi:hypothetical protein [Hymenobacter properus]|uniref:Periplasmic heavy metal sensor n=1 Tax=Hymenobacter properus TaxID=2791026 RepID=A0A931FJ64_9BACT|nr:hypothetical protein [Hymenobacter properus]MBF9140175.1 hypothetical protein [Hymenobacter properus]MBR7718982.1 hypothetical protein [Microvirga sp. SRT04]
MNKILVLLAATLATGLTAAAQAPASPTPAADLQKAPDQQVQRRVQYLAQQLGLSPDQQAKLEPILLAQRQDMQALRTRVQTNGRQRGMGQELKAAQARYAEQIRAVLTPEQFVKFEQLRDEQRDKLRERRANGQGLGQ